MAHRTTEAELDIPYLASALQSAELAEIEETRKEQQTRVEGVGVDRLDGVVGLYRVEVHMHNERSREKAYPGIIHTMVKGDRFGGGALMGMYACADERCGGFVHPDHYHPGHYPPTATCPKCGVIWHPSQVFAHRKYRLTNQNWAYAISRTVLRLGMDTDVMIVFFSEPLVQPTLDAQASPRLGLDPVHKSRAAIRKVVYPLGRLLKDMSTGVALEARMSAFIMA